MPGEFGKGAEERCSPCVCAGRICFQDLPRGPILGFNERALNRETPMDGTGLPLAGVQVIEMTHMVMGPTCGIVLAQLGAEVIKVEPPQGDKTLSLGGMGVSFFPLFNRGKRSVVLDFARPDDRDTMHRLLAS